MFSGADLLRLYDLKLELSVTVQYLTVTRKNPFQIGCADRIFAFYSKFSYGQRSKCADLLNSYIDTIYAAALHFTALFSPSKKTKPLKQLYWG